MQVRTYLKGDLMASLEIYRGSSGDGNQTIKQDFDAVQFLVNDQKSHSEFSLSCCLMCSGALIRAAVDVQF